MSPKVYVVIVNFNGHYDTIECLESLLKSAYDNFQIIVVDNSETEASLAEVLKWSNGDEIQITTDFDALVFPLVAKPVPVSILDAAELSHAAPENLQSSKIIFIRSKVNAGFAAANNLALSLIQNLNDSTYIWLLNNDTVVERNSLPELVRTAELAQPDVAMWGAKMFFYHNPSKIQGAGFIFLS